MRALKSILALLVAGFAALVTPAQGMTFIIDKVNLSSSTDFDWYVYGSGEIVDGDADELFKLLQTVYASAGQSQKMYVYLDSPGGSLYEGMKIGQLISRLKADTDVGRRTQAKDGKIIPASGECSSACVWAYLGGNYRFLRGDSKIGVHQFAFGTKSQVQSRDAATVITQAVAADIVKFIKENRADTEFFSLMTGTLPAEIYFVPPQKLRELRVVTDHIWDENWSFEISQDNDAYLRIWQQSYHGENKLLLTCIKKLFAGSVLIETPENSVGPFTVGLFVDGKLNTIPEELIVKKPKMEGKYMTSAFGVEPNLASRLLTAQTIGAAIQGRDRDRFFGFQIKTAKGRDKLSKMIRGCQ